jgi:3-oxoacyl-ACP reductase-like protein
VSIENSLAALTAALLANAEATAGLTAAWNTLKAKADAIEKAGKADDVAAAGVPLTEKAAAKGKPAATPPAAAPAPAASAAPTTAAASPSEAVADRDTLLELIKAKAKTHRDEVVAAMGKYGAKRGSEVKDEDLAACVADLQAVGVEAEDLA